MHRFILLAIASSLCMANLTPATAGSDFIDPLYQKLIAEYGQSNRQSDWVNPWVPGATGVETRSEISGDGHLNEIVAQYTREMLDRGGWINAMLTNSNYAAGTPLLAVRIGGGVTIVAGNSSL